MHNTRIINGRALLILAALATAAVLAACGSSSSKGSSSTTASAAGATGARGAQFAKLQACLKQHGVTLPNRGQLRRPGGATGATGATGGPSRSGGPGLFGGGRAPGGAGRGGFLGNNPKMAAALKACGANFPRGGFGNRVNAGRFRAEREAAINKFAACVAQHGYKLPKANFSGTGPVFPTSIENNAKFKAASKDCKLTLPSFRPGGGFGGGPPPGAPGSGA